MSDPRIAKLLLRLRALERRATLLGPHMVTQTAFLSEFEEGVNWGHELVSTYGSEKIPELLEESKARVDLAVLEFKGLTTRMSHGGMRINEAQLAKIMSAIMNTFFYHTGVRKTLLESGSRE